MKIGDSVAIMIGGGLYNMGNFRGEIVGKKERPKSFMQKAGTFFVVEVGNELFYRQEEDLTPINKKP